MMCFVVLVPTIKQKLKLLLFFANMLLVSAASPVAGCGRSRRQPGRESCCLTGLPTPQGVLGVRVGTETASQAEAPSDYESAVATDLRPMSCDGLFFPPPSIWGLGRGTP